MSAAARGDSERMVKSAYGVLQRIIKSLEPEYSLTADKLEDVVLDALKQHGAHLAVHNIQQTNIDAFKLTCWIGGSLLERLEKNDGHQCGIVIDAILKTLRELMILETQWFLLVPPKCMALLKSFLLQEWNGNTKHGIWMNGLYMSFHNAIWSWKEGKAYKIPL